ncbi:MAG: ATP-binding cassette domain-containing protein [Chlamydiota bacterium]|nr:ATP-binding cassette domain-containing protein [Chlamydiota bacterium]
MIQFNSLGKSFGGRTIFSDTSLTINRGEKCGLVGRNGSGKTTLFRLIIGQEESSEGEVNLPKHYRIGYLDQHITFTKDTILEEGATGLPPGDEESLYKVEAILGGLGFSDDDFEKHPSDFSGGYQLRLHLAKVLLSDPDCLLLDEPTNYLDIVSIRWLQKFLKSWRKELVLISHDREFMDNVSTHTLGIHRNKIRKTKGGTEEFFQQILQEEEVHEKTRAKLEQKKTKSEAFIKRFGTKATKAKQAQSKKKALERLPTLEKLAAIDDLDFSFNFAEFPGKQMLSATDVCFSYDSNASDHLIDNLNLETLKGECIAIIGKNGRGKSTILKLLGQELSPQEGNIKSAEKLKIGYFGQTNIDRLHKEHTIDQEISLANSSLSISDIRRICGIMMFSGDDAKKTISVLSGGERSRVLLGKILASPCNLLLLDEPSHHLDMESIEALITAITEFQGSVIIVTHSEMLLKQLPLTKIVVCKHNKQDLIIGDYEDFESQGGWHDDDSTNSNAPKQKLNRQEARQLSAEIVKSRAKALKPLQKQMVAIENQIMELEDKLKEDNDLLIEVTTAEQSELIKKYSKQISKHQQQIDTLFKELDSYSSKYQREKDKFDEELDAINKGL